MKEGFSQRLGRVVFHILLCISLTVLGTTSVTVRSAEAAPQVGSIPLAPRKPVQKPVCSPPRCVPPQRLVCDRPDGCPGGCGVQCVAAPVTPRVVELPKLTLSESEDEVTFDIRQIQGMLRKGEVLEIELLTKDKKSYAGELATFYALADKLCYVASVSSDMVIAQQCPVGNKVVALQNWGSAITYLSGIAKGVRPDSKSARSYAAFVRSNPGVVYLIGKGRSVVPMMVKDLQGVINGTARMSNSLPIEFDGCSFPQTASGNQLSKVCAAALPIPPLMIVDKGDKLTLKRETKGAVSVFVQISTRGKNAKKANPVATLPVDVQKKSSAQSSSSSVSSSSSSSVSSSSKSSSSSTDTTSTTEDTTTTSSSASSFHAECGKRNELPVQYDGPPISVYVGNFCLPNSASTDSQCFGSSSSGKCDRKSLSKSACAEFCKSFESRSAKGRKDQAAAHQACYDLLEKNNKKHPAEAGQCPGICPVKGTKGCINPSGAGKFDTWGGHSGFGKQGMSSEEISRDDWNHCFNVYCRIDSGNEFRIEWECSDCDYDPSWDSTSEVPTTEGCSPDGKGQYCGCHVMYSPVDSKGHVLTVARYAKLSKDTVSEADCKSGKVTLEGVGKYHLEKVMPDYELTGSGSSVDSTDSTTGTEDTTTSTEVNTTSEVSAESSSSSSTGDTGNSTETTSTTEETTTSLETTLVPEDTTSTTEVSTTTEVTTTSNSSSESWSSSSASDKIYACMCDGKDDTGRIVRGESRPPDTKAQCDVFCPPSQRDKDGWCTKTDGLGTKSKVRNCKWELTDPPLN